MVAQDKVVQLTALCAVISFFHISQSLERHSLTESPRLSCFLVFLISGLTCYILSCFTKWLPGADGRFKISQRWKHQRLPSTASDEGAPKESNGVTPKRPRRWSLPVVVMCITFRLEIFHRVNYQQQCSTPGIESFLCILLFAYEIYTTRRKWGFPTAEDPDDPWRSFFDDLYDWFSGPRVMMTMSVIGALMFATGTYYAVGQITPSTYFCFYLIESRRTTLLLQLIGLVLDAAIVVLLWQMLAWANTTKLRLRTLGTVLILSALSMSFIWMGNRWLKHDRMLHPGFGFLYGFDIIVDSLTFATLMISATFWVCETSPLTPASITTFIVGAVRASVNVISYGDWLHQSRTSAVVPLWFISLGMVWFTYCHNLRSVIFIRRVFLAIILGTLLLTATIFILVRRPETFSKRHPINDLIYKARVEHEQYLRHATTSSNTKVAVDVYKERHKGREPPPNFGSWYNYAHGTVILDQFNQIDRDLEPFRAFSPQELLRRVAMTAWAPGVGNIIIRNGTATPIPPSSVEGGESSEDLEELAAMINKFAIFLPDMILPININPSPRILPSGDRTSLKHRVQVARSPSDDNILPWETMIDMIKGVIVSGNMDPGGMQPTAQIWKNYSPAEYRQTQVMACPPDSPMRMNPHWSVGEFCASCAEQHSQGQILSDWEQSLKYCSQPDLKYLHGMSLTSPSYPPTDDLLPLFGPSKTEPFADIIIPMPRKADEQPDVRWEFNRRYDTLFWRGQVGDNWLDDQALRGSHKLRLRHLVGASNHRDEVTMILPIAGKKDRFGYEKVNTFQVNNALPFSFGLSNSSACLEKDCRLIHEAYGFRKELQEPLEFRYVFLLDDDAQPPADFLRTLKSRSVPFVSTIFQTWYTERLMPWIHFVPIDLRYQGLHTTFAYFTGTEKRPKLNGRETNLKARPKDAKWIGQQGMQWAERALGEKDMEVYLFRLLLEWGRLLDERRDSIGFRYDEKGEFHNDAWT